MRTKGVDGTEEELAVEAVARIASDLILMGQGRDVLAIYAQAAPKSDDGDDGDGKKSPLVRALERMPGMGSGPERSQTEAGERAGAVIPEVYRPGATYPQSVVPPGQPFFAPQGQLLPADLDEPAIARGPDAPPPAPGGHPPPPGSPTPPPYTPDHGENFEKKSPAEAGAE